MTKLEAKQLIKEATSAGRNALLEQEAKALLSTWGIPVPKSVSGQWPVISGRKDIESALKELTPPFALKIVSSEILHKSDVGGVVTDLKGAEEISNALTQIMKNLSKKAPRARIEGFLLEEMAPKGIEVIIGGLRDEQFGPAVMFGIGGIAVELMKDVSYRLAPLDKEEAMSMMKELKSYPLLTGYRGSSPVDMDKLGEAIVKVSEMIAELEGIKEIEINPLIAYKDGVMAVDARVVLTGGAL
ncbi:acetate--CoA ligase family protein [Pseudomonas sp.]|uniref:acetate--CoA ligase family protein n=1 Tax=Pseudomonas sp. TaxID=306 RepID=UPI002728B612|nr:acetate--CoA ligase family protein [Pseudomonas sp.]MDO8707090.1 acetate--CoA ligase family protein [Pseudomonas sp.]